MKPIPTFPFGECLDICRLQGDWIHGAAALSALLEIQNLKPFRLREYLTYAPCFQVFHHRLRAISHFIGEVSRYARMKNRQVTLVLPPMDPRKVEFINEIISAHHIQLHKVSDMKDVSWIKFQSNISSATEDTLIAAIVRARNWYRHVC
jgi:hypothetical protein